MDDAVIDASAMVDLLLGNDLGRRVGSRLAGTILHAPAHLDAEVLSALGRLHRAGELDAEAVTVRLRALAVAQVARHSVAELLLDSWDRRGQLRLVDAVYVELAARLQAPLITTDRRLRNEHVAEVISD